MSKQRERARKYRGTIEGSAWTPGRGSANMVFKPKSLPYNIMSGVIDALIMIKTDPTNVFTKGVKLATKGGVVLGGIDEATGAAKAIGRADTTVGEQNCWNQVWFHVYLPHKPQHYDKKLPMVSA
jgi:hypothetical protein